MSMALPDVKSLADCIDYSKTVHPYWPQLLALPQQVGQQISNTQALQILYISTNPVISGLALSIAIAPIFLVAAEINRNYSQVDRAWSILPTIFVAHFCFYAHAVGLPAERLDALFAASTVWSIRLTFNYWRKGGYSIGSEDYRWQVLQKRWGPLAFHLLNATFISFGQCVLLFMISLPAYVMLLVGKFTGEGLQTVDMLLATAMVGFVAFSFAADQQQWDYQAVKHEYRRTAHHPKDCLYSRDSLDRGFLAEGFWAWSRHPNYACEQAVWMTVFWWSCNLTNAAYNWSGVGILAYLALFQGSVWITELITADKYPEYKEYQKQVGMFVPGGFSYTPSNKQEVAAKKGKKSS